MKKFYLLTVCSFMFWTVEAQTLVFHTNFDNGQAQDISGNNLNGILMNGPTACPGVSGQAGTALYFDGVNDHVEIPATTDLNLSKWTLHATVRPDGFNSQACQTSGILWHGDQWSDQFYGLYICDNWYDSDCLYDSGEDAFGGQAAGTNQMDFQSSWYTTNGHVAAAQWYCVVMTYDGDTMALYIDGDLVKKEPLASNYSYIDPVSLVIGNGPQTGFYYWFKGAIDEVSIWDDAVTQAQVTNTVCGSFLTASVTNTNSVTREIAVYPSPAADLVYIETVNEMKGAEWTVLNCVGQSVMSGNITNSKESIGINDLPAGLYMIRISKDNIEELRKFIKN